LKLAKLKCDPIERLVKCANILFEDNQIEQAGNLYAKLIPYIAPTLKAVEISQDGEAPINFNISIGGPKK
jgi:hypothetical protein